MRRSVEGGTRGDSALRSGPVRLGSPIASSSTVGTREFVLRAFALCPASPCRAEAYRVALSNVGQNPLNSSYTSILFRVDGRTYAWEIGEQGVAMLPNTFGEFMSVEMPRVLFEELAAGESDRVEFGGAAFLLTPGDRRTLRDLLTRTAGAE